MELQRASLTERASLPGRHRGNREKERLEHQRKIKRKTIEPLVRSSMSVAPADYSERPEVPLRREASAAGGLGVGMPTHQHLHPPAGPPRRRLPLHLLSTTNQQHKVLGVQQQIPTKLALLSRGKEKAGRSMKATHRSDSSNPVSSPEGSTPDCQSPVPPGSLQKPPTPPPPSAAAQSPGSPHYHGQLPGPQTQTQGQQQTHPGLGLSHSVSPPYSFPSSKEDKEDKEDVIFF
ncbi:hypothetical protein CRUP_017279 [Coryphaenoides rupestris]|nr:hypothetical protein CRUP_017279 [Coryphaenoides rupestris]